MKKILGVFCALVSMASLVGSDINWSTPPDTISTTNLDSSNPQVVLDSNGNSTAAWVENGFIKSASRPTGGSWGTITTLSNSGASQPGLAVDPSGNVTAVWNEGGVIKASSLPFNGNWGTAASVSSSGASSPGIGVDDSGNIVVIWVRNGFIEAASQAFGGNFGSVSMISSSGADSPKLAMGADGTAVAVWHGVLNSVDTIYASTLSFGGSWASEVAISDANTNSMNPSVGVDLNGNIAVAWFKFDLSLSVYSNVIVQAVLLPSGGSWTTPTDISSPGFINPSNLFVRVVWDDHGSVLVVWNNSSDGASFTIGSAAKSRNNPWQLGGEVVTNNVYSYDADLKTIDIGDSLLVYMFFDGASPIIQSSQSDIERTVQNLWSVPINVSTDPNNAFPRTAIAHIGDEIHAVAVWVNFNNTNNVVQASFGTKDVLAGPTNLSVTQNVNNFGVFNEYYNTLSWDASIDPSIVSYVIYRNGVFFAQVSSAVLQVVDNNQIQNGSVTYGVAAVNSEQDQSPFAFISFP